MGKWEWDDVNIKIHINTVYFILILLLSEY